MHSKHALGTSVYPQRNHAETYEELTTCAQDMEWSIATNGGEASVQDPNKEKEYEDFEKWGKSYFTSGISKVIPTKLK